MINMSDLNGHNNLYMIVFGNDVYGFERLWRTVKPRWHFRYLRDARREASEYSNAHIFKLHFYNDSDLPDIQRVW